MNSADREGVNVEHHKHNPNIGRDEVPKRVDRAH